MARRRPRLTSVGSVLAELGYIYRRADAGRMTWPDAQAAARILREVRHCLEASDVEQRLRALEAAAERDREDGPPPWSTNGGDRHVARH